jgi:tetratricopeptide (TPR) repeat protein
VNYWIPWLALAGGMLVIILFGLMQAMGSKEHYGWMIVPIFMVALSFIFLIFRPTLPTGPNLPIEVGLSQKGGFNIIKNVVINKPILGTGPETFSLNYTQYKPSEVNQTIFWNIKFSKAPSIFYTAISDAGILGGLALLAIVVWFIFTAVKSLMRSGDDNPLKKFVSIGLFAAWFGLAIGLFLYPQNLVLIFVFWLLISLYFAQNALFKENIYNIKKNPKVVLISTFSLVIGIVLVIGFLYLEGIRFVAEVKYKQGIDLIQVDDDLENGINKLLSSATINPYEDRTYRVLAQYFLTKINADINVADAQQRANLVQMDAVNAINAATQSTRLFPENYINWLIRGQVYSGLMGLVTGADSWAETTYQKAAELDPSDPYLLTEWGKVYINDADLISSDAKTDSTAKAKWNAYLEQAMDKFNQAVGIKPDYATAHFEMATIYSRQGKLADAIKKLEINRQLLPQDAGTAFQLGVLYYRAEKYDQAKSEFIRAIGINSNYSNARYFLGLLYDRENNKQSALDQFEKIAQLNPDNEEIKQIISNLKNGLPALGSPELGPPNQPEEIPIEGSSGA